MKSQKTLTKRVLGLVVLMAMVFSCIATANATTTSTDATATTTAVTTASADGTTTTTSTDAAGTTSEIVSTSSDATDANNVVPDGIPELGLKFPTLAKELQSLKLLLMPVSGFNPYATGKLAPTTLVKVAYAKQALIDVIATEDTWKAATKDMTPEQINAMFDTNLRPLFTVMLYDEKAWDEQANAGVTSADIVGTDALTEVGRKNGSVYIAVKESSSTEGLTDEEKAEFEGFSKDLDATIAATELVESTGSLPMGPSTTSQDQGALTPANMTGAFPKFTAKDLDGNTITSDELFAKNKMTIINFWGTFCDPCIEEMPDLGEIAKELPEGVQLIGVVVDGTGNEDTAKQIVEKTKADYLHLLPDAGLDGFSRSLQGVPSTIFVDSQGNMVGELLLGGGLSKDQLKAIYDEHLKLIP